MKTFAIACAYMSAIFVFGIVFAIAGIPLLAPIIKKSGIFPVPIGLLSVPFYLLLSPALSFVWGYRTKDSLKPLGFVLRVLPMALIGGALLATLVISGAWVT